MRPLSAFENNVAFATFLRACREHDLALMLVWEGRSGDHRFSGPNLRKFAVYHGPTASSQAWLSSRASAPTALPCGGWK